VSLTVTFEEPNPTDTPPRLGDWIQVRVTPVRVRGDRSVTFRILDTEAEPVTDPLQADPVSGTDSWRFDGVDGLGLTAGDNYIVVAVARDMDGDVLVDTGSGTITAEKQ